MAAELCASDVRHGQRRDRLGAASLCARELGAAATTFAGRPRSAMQQRHRRGSARWRIEAGGGGGTRSGWRGSRRRADLGRRQGSRLPSSRGAGGGWASNCRVRDGGVSRIFAGDVK
uniref:Uncharacterized protein n=1 Tax=Arundo donax TaxID=35708 RepID=A0A0A8ZFK5_ARUDO